MAFSIESSIFDLSISFVIVFELRHRVDKRLVTVEIETGDAAAAAAVGAVATVVAEAVVVVREAPLLLKFV
jgi:hypothetical protein